MVDLGGGQYNVAAITVLHELEESGPKRRFKMVYETQRRNPAHGGRAEFNSAVSDDGYHWTELAVQPHNLS
ncbi:hypothetical protein KFU94_23495 [Chloroflexi bacterium TSY]|nr:hypothetical protein [Chloroflexi bacterium TSY]